MLQGIPAMLYLDNGPVAKSSTFRRMMTQLGVDVRTHMPRGSGERRVTARSKGKVERPVRTVKEAHETLYHCHTPQSEAEANLWLRNYLVATTPAAPVGAALASRGLVVQVGGSGLRAMCAWDRFRTFARKPERRRVGIDARGQVDGISYEVDPSLAGETVTFWWGLLDQGLFVEHADQRFGPFGPSTGRPRCIAIAACANPRPMSGSTGRGAGRQAGLSRSAGRIGTDADAAGRSRLHGAVRRSGPVPGTTPSQHSGRQARHRGLSRPPIGEAGGRRSRLHRRAASWRRWSGAPSSPACGDLLVTTDRGELRRQQHGRRERHALDHRERVRGAARPCDQSRRRHRRHRCRRSRSRYR